jgi:predicted pyridoxine 5'-phosphate oxidase superfamily flavin-nucleotide-binding protein
MSARGEGMRITDAVRANIDNSVLCWLATVGADGVPNVSPKEIFASYGDDGIVIADIASAGSVKNIAGHPDVCVSFIDVFRQRGFKVTGVARIIPPDAEDFAIVGAELLRMAGKDFPVRNVISVEAKRIAPIWAPSYALFPDRTEEEQMARAYDTYGVRPKR